MSWLLRVACGWTRRQTVGRILTILLVWSSMYLLMNYPWKWTPAETDTIYEDVGSLGIETLPNRTFRTRNLILSSIENGSKRHVFAKSGIFIKNHSHVNSSDTNYVVNVDLSPIKSSADMVKKMAEIVPSIPLEYLNLTHTYKIKNCSSYPNFYDLQFNNIAWQHFHSSRRNGTTFYIFGAYYDNRTNPVVRVLVMVDKISPPNITCQLWYESSKPVTTSAKEFVYVWHKGWGNHKDGILQPFLITCPCDQNQKQPEKIPHSVSLVDNPCDNAANNVRVFFNHPLIQKGFAVCVKGMSFWEQDVSVRLIEWLELLHLLGADKVFFYELSVHPNVSKVIDYYKRLGRVDSTFLTLPGTQPNYFSVIDFYLKNKKVVKRQNELIPYNDCFYKNMYTYKYIVLLDTDEIIVPLKDSTWDSLMKKVTYLSKQTTREPRGSYYADNVYFFDDSVHSHGWFDSVPHYMHMLQHVYRAKNHTKTGSFVKSFFDTKNVVALHNHFPIRCFKSFCRNYHINKTLAQLQHYRQDCDPSIRQACIDDFHKYTVEDKNLWRFKDPLVENTNRVLRALGFLKSTNK